MINYVLSKIFGSKSARDMKKLMPLVARINEIEESYQRLTEDQLKAKTQEFKDRLAKGETLDDILPEAFATVKNTCRRLMGTKINICDQERTWDMIPFDVQLMGGIVLHRGNIAEMATGEGKTLVATLPMYLNALSGKNCQLVTVNDYLAKRDSEWMGAIYRYLGLTVGCLQNEMMPTQRREQYACDITYGTNSEFGFDYLRDMGMAMSKEQMVQRNHYYAIIDEVDSILIDEARTPLIISGPVAVSTHQFDVLKSGIDELFKKQSFLCSRLISEAKDIFKDAAAGSPEEEEALIKLLQVRFGMPQHRQLMHTLEDSTILKKMEKLEGSVRSDQNRGLLQQIQADLFFVIDEKGHEADLTEKGRTALSPDNPEMFVLPDLLSTIHDIDTDTKLSDADKIKKKQDFQEEFSKNSEKLHNISQLLKAYCLFEKDVHYVVQDNKVLIVDEHTGRLMPGRRFSEGLHQALEAKENVSIERETQTLATITIQNYFRMYEKLAGMTGTAETEANEFHQIYKLDVIVVPSNKPCVRADTNDCIYKTKREKYKAILDEVKECHEAGQPVLLGTVSVEVSEIISRMLKRERIPHNVLNAKNHQFEADIVARAGQRGAVTVATNMAGRGTDIKLGGTTATPEEYEAVRKAGGLHVIGSERHDSRRIDRQLRGRCARQGDPGSSRFYVSLEDNLMRLFGSDRVASIMSRLGLEEGEELQHPLLNKSIETAQKRVEQHHFSIRKRTLQYDDVMNKQREVLYGFRKEVIQSDNPKEILFDILDSEIEARVEEAFEYSGKIVVSFHSEELLAWLNSTFPLGFTAKDFSTHNEDGIPDRNLVLKTINERVSNAYTIKCSLETPDSQKWLERHTLLEAIDRLWQEHLYAMDHLRSSIGLRAYAQKDPLNEYKQEAFKVFDALMTEIYQEILTNMFRSATTLAAFEKLLASLPQNLIHDQIDQFGGTGGEQAAAQAGPEGQPAEISAEPHITFVRNTPKTGRNDPCPCGSGKKYKKCCGK
ncbi:MAG TPA: preprotein translocase subunit SecA [Lentisphaeria bacterium]|nr:MAG: preprotein translocase subunit SecA [Lentisphaerae bacterium GWF2_49_21]HBC86855.1 preprotein translocase subunit SecA [Lentisphaeria bacterium]